MKQIGETAGQQPDGAAAPTLMFKVTSIEAIQCDAPYAGELSGIPLAVALEIETAAGYVGPLEVNGVPGQVTFPPLPLITGGDTRTPAPE